MISLKDEWLDLTVEKAIDPDLPICDAHIHLRRRYHLADFLDDFTGGHNVKSTVIIQSFLNQMEGEGGGMTPVEETEFLTAEIENSKAGTALSAVIVSYADLAQGDTSASVLESHLEVGHGRLRGIRCMPPWDLVKGNLESTKGWILQAGFLEGLACLQRYGLSLDIMLSPYLFKDLVDMAGKFPQTPVILNHIGCPILGGKSGIELETAISEWRQGIASLRCCENIYIKLGGMAMDTFGFTWGKQPAPPDSVKLAEAMAPYYLHCIEQLGVKRCMFESNFPVDKESYSYTVLWNAFKRITENFSRVERQALFHDTAVTVYRFR